MGAPMLISSKELARIAGQAIATLNDKQTAELYDSRGATLEIGAKPRSALYNSVWALLRKSVQSDPQMAQRFQQAQTPIVDQSQPVSIVLRPVGLPTVTIPGPNGSSGISLLGRPEARIQLGRPSGRVGRGGRIPPPNER